MCSISAGQLGQTKRNEYTVRCVTEREAPMWEFSTEPEFQEKLDWMERFVREEVEPLDLLFPRSR
jgi:hypothetical protein